MRQYSQVEKPNRVVSHVRLAPGPHKTRSFMERRLGKHQKETTLAVWEHQSPRSKVWVIGSTKKESNYHDSETENITSKTKEAWYPPHHIHVSTQLPWKLKRSFSAQKAPIQPCRPKSDSASLGAIWAQFKPTQPHQKPIPACVLQSRAGTHFSPLVRISPR